MKWNEIQLIKKLMQLLQSSISPFTDNIMAAAATTTALVTQKPPSASKRNLEMGFHF